MEIHYKNKNVQKQCTDLKTAKKKCTEVASKLLQLINFIEKADDLGMVLSFPRYRFHALHGKRKGYFAMDINGKKSSYRLLVSFPGEIAEEVFVHASSITIISIEEVSKHYE